VEPPEATAAGSSRLGSVADHSTGLAVATRVDHDIAVERGDHVLLLVALHVLS
jgi:hypothetical protein